MTYTRGNKLNCV